VKSDKHTLTFWVRLQLRSPNSARRAEKSILRGGKRREEEKWILCHQMPPIWHPLLPVKMSDDEFTEREVHFSLNGTTNVNLEAQMSIF